MIKAPRLLGLLTTTALCTGCLPDAEPETNGVGGGGGSETATALDAMAGNGGSAADAGSSEAPPPPQAVLWFGLNTPSGAACSTAQTYQLPPDARATITSSSAAGERLIDGDENVVECTVRPNSRDTDFSVRLRLASGDIGNFTANGTLTETGGELQVSFNTALSSLLQSDCVATVEVLRPGAIWLTGLRCPSLIDPSAPGIQCDGQGGLIFENCDG